MQLEKFLFMHMLVDKNSDCSIEERKISTTFETGDLPHGLCLTYRDVSTKNQEINMRHMRQTRRTRQSCKIVLTASLLQ